MKKFTLFSMAAMLLLSGQAPAQDKTDYPPSAYPMEGIYHLGVVCQSNE
mgnify:CR=1 FL=1